MPNVKAPRKPFNLLLSLDEYEMLQALSKETGSSCGALLRSALRARYAHTLQFVPTCASGSPCFVPQMHMPPTRSKPGITPEGRGHE